MADIDLQTLIPVITLIFLIAPAFVLLYVLVQNRRKKRHLEEKELMQLTFETELVKTQMEVREQTMQTIGADLHDNIGQLLSLTSLTLNSVVLNDLQKAQQKIDAAIDLTGRSIKEMRLLGKLLQGEQLIGMGLEEAIRYEINWIEKAGQYEIIYAIEGEKPDHYNTDQDLILFRMLQEALNNIMKHSFATRINIRLEYSKEAIRLQVEDDGKGFNVDGWPEERGMGLHNIHKRAGIIGGKVLISSNPGQGTCIDIFIPYP